MKAHDDESLTATMKLLMRADSRVPRISRTGEDSTMIGRPAG